MLVSSLAAAPARRCLFALGLCALLSPPAFADDVLVVTDTRHPVQAAGGARVIHLDIPARLEAELSAGLPTDSTQAAKLMRQRLDAGGKTLQRRFADACQGVVDAWSLGVDKLPAVIVGRRYVIYGEPDVARAVARIKRHRSTQP
jgi:integrating conjugative element protein (TIGR03757 family)